MSNDCTIYVVDDDRAAAMSVSALLTTIGLNVEAYHSAQDFLAAFDRDRQGCLVLDVRMQGMDGLELQAALVADGVSIPIIMISGHADSDISRRALQNGAVAFLEKPFDGRELCRVVREALGRAN